MNANFTLLPVLFFMCCIPVTKHARQSVYFYVNNLFLGSIKDGFLNTASGSNEII